MSVGGAETIELARCSSCQGRFLPSDGPCPHCGSTSRETYSAPALGKVLAATELIHPASGWEAPHRLVLVELPESVRVLAIAEGSLPAVGAVVVIRQDGEVYRARGEPGSEPPGTGRGEGESPRVGTADASFEPPR